MAELTNKQRIFVEYYLDCLNATVAAKRAGYSEKTARSIGAENLTKPDIAAAVQKGLSDLAMARDEVLARLAEHARGNIGAFVSVDDDGKPKGFSLSADRPLHMVKKVTVTDKGWSFEMYDAQAALGLLGKHHGLFVDRTEITGKDGAPIAFNWSTAVAEIADGSDSRIDASGNDASAVDGEALG